MNRTMIARGTTLFLGALLVLFVASSPFLGQRKSASNYKKITLRTSEPLSSVAERWNISAVELATANGLEINTRLRKGQRILIPAAKLSARASVQENTGEVIGKRIVFADGTYLDVDDTWKVGDSLWYRRRGTSASARGEVVRTENRYKPRNTAEAVKTTPKEVTTKATPTEMATWIYLVDGARLRVEEVREVSDGAWYNRGNVAVFLARERISRIEREVPEVGGDSWKQHGWSSGNIAIDQLIKNNATRFGIDPYLVFLVIEQESHFRTRALSPKGARGLMQLMPGTARRFGVSRSFDPAENIRGGTQYLKELLTMFDGRVDLALASYNAGEGRVLDYGNRVPPFKETREYVRRISSRYRNHLAK